MLTCITVGTNISNVKSFLTESWVAAAEPATVLERELNMNDTPTYSNFFHCIHDEPEERGVIGRGCHYSVFRVAEFFDVTGNRVDHALVHDFGVVWDEDHDTRVIEAIERIFLAGLLFPVQFIGERKGMLTLILDSKFLHSNNNNDLKIYKGKIDAISSGQLSDSWPAEFGVFDKTARNGSPHQTDYAGLIADSEQKVDIYLRNIDNLWRIGSWPFKPLNPDGST